MSDFSILQEVIKMDVSYPPNSVCFPRHCHPQIKIILINKGSVIFHCGSDEFTAACGDVIVMNSNELHTATSCETGVTYSYFFVDLSILHQDLQDTCYQQYIFPIISNKLLFQNLIRNNKKIANCMEIICEEYNKHLYGYELAIKSSLLQLFVLLIRGYRKESKQHSYKSSNIHLKQMDRAVLFMKRNLREKISNYDVAKAVNVSEAHFCRLFKLIIGKTPNEYLTIMRINEAEQLLLYTSLSISEIALKCGFNSSSYFSHIYKKQKKRRPKDYRCPKKYGM